MFRTDEDGQVVVETDGKDVEGEHLHGAHVQDDHDASTTTKTRWHEGANGKLEGDVHDFRRHAIRLIATTKNWSPTKLIGCALAVHRELGPGYLESFYRKAMCLELGAHALAFET